MQSNAICAILLILRYHILLYTLFLKQLKSQVCLPTVICDICAAETALLHLYCYEQWENASILGHHVFLETNEWEVKTCPYLQESMVALAIYSTVLWLNEARLSCHVQVC